MELDRRLLDYIVGLDTEINELVDGSVSYRLALFKPQFSALINEVSPICLNIVRVDRRRSEMYGTVRIKCIPVCVF